MIKDVDQSVDRLQRAIIPSFHQNCPARTTRAPRTVPCWNKQLSGLRTKTRRLFNTAKRTGQWDNYTEALTCYNKEIRRAKRSSWRRHCQEINDIPGSARLMKIMSKQATNKVSKSGLPNRQFTKTGKGTLSELFRVDFPNSLLSDDLDRGSKTWTSVEVRRTGQTGTWLRS
jgi:hypothetical protein